MKSQETLKNVLKLYRHEAINFWPVIRHDNPGMFSMFILSCLVAGSSLAFSFKVDPKEYLFRSASSEMISYNRSLAGLC